MSGINWGWVGCVEGFNQENLELLGGIKQPVLFRAVVFVSDRGKEREFKGKKLAED